MERENNKLKFTLIWSSCICVLLLMVGLGVSSSAKGTRAAGTYQIYSCDDGNLSGNKCNKTFSGLDLKAVADGKSCSSLWSGSAGNCSVQSISTGGRYSWSCTCSKAASTSTGTCAGVLTNSSNYAGGGVAYDCEPLSNASYGYCCIKKESSGDGNQTEGDNDGNQTGDGNDGNQTEDGECVGADCNNNEKEDGTGCGPASCPAGQYLVEENGCNKCKSCPTGKVCYGGISQPQSCISGSVPNENADTCVQIKQCYCYGVDYGKEQCKYMTAFDADEFGAVLATDSSKCDGSSTSIKYTVNFYVNGVVNDTFVCESKDIDDTKTCTKKTLHAGETWYVDKECTTSRVVQDYVTGDNNYYRCTGNTNPGTGGSGGGTTTPPSSEPSSSEPSVSDPSDEEVSSRPSDENVETNPPTGDIAIFVVWVLAAAAIVYSVWYFKQVREN